MKLSNRLGIVFDRVLGVLSAASGVLILTIILLTGIEVVGRYAFGYGAGWITEIINNLLIYVTFLGVAWLQKEKGHVAIDMVYNRLNLKSRLIFDIVVSFMALVACLVMTWYSGETAVDDLVRGIREYSTIRAPRGVIIGIMPVGFFLLFIEFARQFWGHLVHFRASDN